MSLPANQDAIAFLDDEGPFLENMDNQRFESYKSLVENLKQCGIFWVTGLSQIQCQDLRFGQITGFARTIRSEMLVDFATCEVDNVNTSLDVFGKFQIRKEDGTLKPEFEYASIDNTTYTLLLNARRAVEVELE
ncbi:hypothetical protein BGW36DRAFT_431129 [Talaromyces proteolyticus]|uniref:HRPKS sdrA-like NAD(P)-binding domain-containing protein n=1 Tax=Talaromyces proteolyticus TaxID=1131652 RepID=A0AAD4PSQ8_9EURO|nr:uncharacterized protein BGW36DRAFT_431129 [Talaromyces proteolyticus]KAH8691886.1 hypothetical protein BGW36DRAFT_431129 [Talaromyces proteolyticus]